MLVFALFACTDDLPTGDDTSELTIPGDVTYYADLKPMLDRHCIRCHHDGGLGTGDFNDLSHVDAFAELMLSRIDSGEMPPPVADPDCRPYYGSDHMNISDQERQVLADWIDGGKPLGDPADDPGVELVETELVDPDLHLEIDGYEPSYQGAGSPGNEYRCFLLDPELDQDTYLTALAPTIDNDAIVHHMVLTALNPAHKASYMDDPQGWDCINGTGQDLQAMVGAWAPACFRSSCPKVTA